MITLLRYLSGCAKPNYKEVPNGLLVTVNSDWSCTGQFQTLKSCFMILSVTYSINLPSICIAEFLLANVSVVRANK